MSCLPIERQRFTIVSTMDFGIHSLISCAKDEVLDNRLVCILTLEKEKWVLDWIKTQLRERCSLYHPHSLKIYDAFFSEEEIHVVFEHPNGENLLDFLGKYEVTENLARHLFQQIIFAVEYYHHTGIDGLDLSMERVFFSSQDFLVKIFDFGLVNAGSKATRKYSLPYVAPEQLTHPTAAHKHNKASDVWHCGVLLHCLLFRAFPFLPKHSTSQQAHVHNIMRARWSIPAGCKLSSECLDLLQRMLTQDPADRITLPAIKKHPWYRRELPDGVLQYSFLKRPEDGLVQKVDAIGKTWASEQ